jgi:transcription elongation GreA/GreB family factor
MSRAFTREDDNENAISDLGERPVSPHRNLVTAAGLAQIEDEIAALRQELAKAESASDRLRIATLSRDLRYWSARRENAELSEPNTDGDVVRFGMTVTIEDEAGNRKAWKIVGEDEADAAKGSVSHVSPMAQALFGKAAGEMAVVSGKEWEIVGLSAG